MKRTSIRQVFSSAMITATVCIAVVGASTSAVSQSTGKHNFDRLCAPCHGIDGTGKGRDLVEANPPDLTDLSLRNNGKFPFEKVYRTVDGREMMASHKRFAMPFWGIYLQYHDQLTPESNAAIKQRITEIVRYVETMQKK
jgi:mono/diheme cytochrome c family protein